MQVLVLWRETACNGWLDKEILGVFQSLQAVNIWMRQTVGSLEGTAREPYFETRLDVLFQTASSEFCSRLYLELQEVKE